MNLLRDFSAPPVTSYARERRERLWSKVFEQLAKWAPLGVDITSLFRFRYGHFNVSSASGHIPETWTKNRRSRTRTIEYSSVTSKASAYLKAMMPTG